MPYPWPPGFVRIPDEEWTRQPVESLALKYDSVENHGWYANLDPTVQEVSEYLENGHVLVDYSGGTGILIDRLLTANPGKRFGIVNVDSSPKFLRLSLEKLRRDERVGFRLIQYLKAEKRLQFLEEVLPVSSVGGALDGLMSTNAIHLYYGLPDTLASWARCVRPGGRVFIQSGNIARADGERRGWIIDTTVEALQETARAIVWEDSRYAPYRDAMMDEARQARYDDLRHKYFIPVRPLRYYLDALDEAGFDLLQVRHLPVQARTKEWYQFLSVYHEGVLGWVGGVDKIEGKPPTAGAVRDRLDLLRAALDRVFQGAPEFDAEWTYITCERR
ncbi:MAG TPA: hypothetical protein VNZ52_05155 [Candidatus Thermoplasmatota archaeon]|nr:hypothetical protein [Candidatus Thermoplasmatota archaeon]